MIGDDNEQGESFDHSASKLSKLLNVFEAAALDLKTYSLTQIDSASMVAELQQNLSVLATYINLARTELGQ